MRLLLRRELTVTLADDGRPAQHRPAALRACAAWTVEPGCSSDAAWPQQLNAAFARLRLQRCANRPACMALCQQAKVTVAILPSAYTVL